MTSCSSCRKLRTRCWSLCLSQLPRRKGLTTSFYPSSLVQNFVPPLPSLPPLNHFLGLLFFFFERFIRFFFPLFSVQHLERHPWTLICLNPLARSFSQKDNKFNERCALPPGSLRLRLVVWRANILKPERTAVLPVLRVAIPHRGHRACVPSVKMSRVPSERPASAPRLQSPASDLQPRSRHHPPRPRIRPLQRHGLLVHRRRLL